MDNVLILMIGILMGGNLTLLLITWRERMSKSAELGVAVKALQDAAAGLSGLGQNMTPDADVQSGIDGINGVVSSLQALVPPAPQG